MLSTGDKVKNKEDFEDLDQARKGLNIEWVRTCTDVLASSSVIISLNLIGSSEMIGTMVMIFLINLDIAWSLLDHYEPRGGQEDETQLFQPEPCTDSKYRLIECFDNSIGTALHDVFTS